MSLHSTIQDKNAERVCIQLFVFATGRTILASQPGASPTKSMTLWNLDSEERVIFFTVILLSLTAMDSRQPRKCSIHLLNHSRHRRIVESSAATQRVPLGSSTDSILSLQCRLYGTRISGSSWWILLHTLQRSLRILRIILFPSLLIYFLFRLPITENCPSQYGQDTCSRFLTKNSEITKTPESLFSISS
jgi:hypothetical protein